MRLAICASGLFVIASLMCGCSGSTDPATADFQAVSDQGDATRESGAVSVNDATSPESIVQTPMLQATLADAEPSEVLKVFLSALQEDQTRIAENLLTDRARFETKRAQMEVRRVPAADFQIGLTRYATQKQKVAHVESLWTDTDSAGKSDSFDITWVLHRHHSTWRVAGMLTSPAPNEPQVYLDFENPIDMFAKVSAVEAGETIGESHVVPASFENPID